MVRVVGVSLFCVLHNQDRQFCNCTVTHLHVSCSHIQTVLLRICFVYFQMVYNLPDESSYLISTVKGESMVQNKL